MSTPASRSESECSATAVAELTRNMAHIDAVDSCHGNTSVPDTVESEYSLDAAQHEYSSDSRHVVEKQLDAEDTVVPSSDDDSKEGM